jgi:hypothetical protein
VIRDPFEEVEPLEPLGIHEVLTSRAKRSIMWDLIGPHKMWNYSEKYGQNPASPDVLHREYLDMVERKNLLLPLSNALPLLCYIAAESATEAIIASDESFAGISDEDRMKFRMQNVQLGSVITESVVSHLIQNGLIKYGGY